MQYMHRLPPLQYNFCNSQLLSLATFMANHQGKTNLYHDSLNPAHVPFQWVNNPTLSELCFAMIGRADSMQYLNAFVHLPYSICNNCTLTPPLSHTRSSFLIAYSLTSLMAYAPAYLPYSICNTSTRLPSLQHMQHLHSLTFLIAYATPALAYLPYSILAHLPYDICNIYMHSLSSLTAYAIPTLAHLPANKVNKSPLFFLQIQV